MKLRTIIFIAVPLITGIIASATGFSLLWRLFILSLLVPLIGFLWSFISIRNIHGEIGSLPRKNQIGDILENSLKLTNRSKIPKLMLKVQEITDLPGYSNIATANISPGSSLNLQSKVVCSKRGRYSLGTYVMSISDPLGLFEQSRKFGKPQSILIYPKAFDLPFFDPLTYISNGYGAGKWLSSQISPNVASIREYVSGDSLKHIHWHTTAHSSNLMVKVFDPDRSRSTAKSIWVVLDMQETTQAGSDAESTEEYGIAITASIVKKFIELGWPVGLIARGDQRVMFNLETSGGHLENINTALTTLKARGQVPVDQIVNEEPGRFDLNTLTIVITPSWNDKMVTSLLQIRRQMGVVVAILLDSSSFGGPRRTKGIPVSLLQNGVQVYVVKKGDNLVTSLDSRKL
ncbi:MAG TPA: DUF58 domain-containing protein [Dehalococcoidales bacterium]